LDCFFLAVLCALTIVFNLRVGLPVCFPVFWRPLLTPRVQNIFAGTGMDPDFDQAVKEELSLPDGSTDGLVEVDTLTPELYAAIFAFPTPIQVEHLTPVHYAAATGKFDEVKRLLEEGTYHFSPSILMALYLHTLALLFSSTPFSRALFLLRRGVPAAHRAAPIAAVHRCDAPAALPHGHLPVLAAGCAPAERAPCPMVRLDPAPHCLRA
jgi:hypothetical protein